MSHKGCVDDVWKRQLLGDFLDGDILRYSLAPFPNGMPEVLPWKAPLSRVWRLEFEYILEVVQYTTILTICLL